MRVEEADGACCGSRMMMMRFVREIVVEVGRLGSAAPISPMRREDLVVIELIIVFLVGICACLFGWQVEIFGLFSSLFQSPLIGGRVVFRKVMLCEFVLCLPLRFVRCEI